MQQTLDPDLAGDEKIIRCHIAPVDYADGDGFALAVIRALHLHTDAVAQQKVKLTIGSDGRKRRAILHQRFLGQIYCFLRQIGVEFDERRAQARGKPGLAEGGAAGGVVCHQRFVAEANVLPAQLLQ